MTSLYTIIQTENKFYSCYSDSKDHHTKNAKVKSGKPIKLYIFTSLPKPLFYKITIVTDSEIFINVIELVKTCTEVSIMYTSGDNEAHIDNDIYLEKVNYYSEPESFNKNIDDLGKLEYEVAKQQFKYKRFE